MVKRLLLSFIYVSVARTDMVSHAKGSSYVEQYDTKVVCSVFDPREIPHQNEFRYVSYVKIIVIFILLLSFAFVENSTELQLQV